MKIGFDFRMGGSINAGIGRYSFELLKTMLDRSTNDDFVVFYNANNVNTADLEELQARGAELVEANYRHYSFSEQLFFPRLLKAHHLDIVHFPNFNVPLLYKGEYVVTIHDMVHHKISGHKKSRYIKFLAYKYIIEQAAKRAKKIITVTEAAKKEIIEYLGTDPNKIEVTYEAPAPVVKNPGDFNRLKENFLINAPYLLFVGTLERKKNIVNLCLGFDKLLSKYNYNLDLVLVGKVDSHYPEVKEQALSIKHRNRLIFTGYVNNNDQANFYQNAFAFVTASLHEGFGLPGLEAMQYGTPVLAANTEVFNEVYDDAAIYFDGLDPDDIADKINLLVSDQPFHESMRKKSLKRAAMYSWERTADQTLKIYKDTQSLIPIPDKKPESIPQVEPRAPESKEYSPELE
ncbi:glycosyltransferase family 4 protein [bacterium]|nr:MAG: glycosyltransferase family 4 protein [bacterium]